MPLRRRMNHDCRSRRPPVSMNAVVIVLACLSAAPAIAGWPWSVDIFSSGKPNANPVKEWSYQGDIGPTTWGDLSPEFAACKGERQSPVDLREARSLAYSPLTFHYRSNPLSLVNDGRSVRVQFRPGSYMIAGGRQYELIELHFHLPGEHRINGVAADMEIQLTHRDRQGRMAVVAVPVRAGRRMNSTLSRIWDNMPPIGGQRHYDRQAGINAVFLLPSKREYFSYVGSLTEPPCTEGVEWFVLAEPLEVDSGYIRRMAEVVGRNSRPVQPLNGRAVLAVFHR